MLNISEMFYTNAKNVSAEDQTFTEVELTSLRKIIDDTGKWLADAQKEEGALARHLTPTQLTLKNLSEKITALDREVKYMLNKARLATPKKKKKAEEPKVGGNSCPTLC